MSLYIIAFDLNFPAISYEGLVTEIIQYQAVRLFKSVWLVRTERSVQEIKDHLKEHIKFGDKLFIGKITGEWASCGLVEEVPNLLGM